jgi:aldose 1-epimerase
MHTSVSRADPSAVSRGRAVFVTSRACSRLCRVTGFRTRTLTSPDSEIEATFAPRTGMVGCSLTHRGEELLHIGGGLSEYAERGTTFGIPLLYPWANRLAGFDYFAVGKHVRMEHRSSLIALDPNGLPIHGLLGASPHWEVDSAQPRDDALSASLDFGAYPALVQAFPYPHSVQLDILLTGNELHIATTVKPDRGVAVPISFGFHPYFRLPGVPREAWEIEAPVRERLLLDRYMIPTGEREPAGDLNGPLGNRGFDDGYAGVEPDEPFSLTGGGRRIEVRMNECFPFAQVYSPPGAAFLCFEPMTAPTNALRSGDHLPVAEPDKPFAAVWAIAVTDAE